MSSRLPTGLTHSRIADTDHRAPVAKDGRTPRDAREHPTMRAIRRPRIIQSVRPLPVDVYIAARNADRARSPVWTAWQTLVAGSRRRVPVSYC